MTEVLGRPVQGDIYETHIHETEQWPDWQFLELLDAVLNDDRVEGVKWTQYTPYWNDGEACVFSVNDVYVKLIDKTDGGEDDDGWLTTWDLTEGHYPDRIPMLDFDKLYKDLNLLSNSMEHFELFLKKSFGDHAEVTATKEGFSVEYYDHD